MAITYDDCPLVRSLFPTSDFCIEELQWAYAGTTSTEKKIGRELLIMNYEPPVWNLGYDSREVGLVAKSAMSGLQQAERSQLLLDRVEDDFACLRAAYSG